MAVRGHKLSTKRASEKGSALVYILIAIALLAALTVSFMEPSSQQTSSQNTFRSVAAIQGQVDTIRSAIQECVLVYPNGDNCIDGSGSTGHCDGASGDAPNANRRYPLDPNSTFYDNATPAQQTNIVANLRCPGNNPGATGDHDNHASVFGSGKFMPPAPDLFNDWQYYNGVDGVFFWISTSKSDAFLTAALDKLDAQFSACEADVIDATGGAENLDSATTTGVTCANGDTCFRVWMIENGSGPHNDYTASGNVCGGSQI